MGSVDFFGGSGASGGSGARGPRGLRGADGPRGPSGEEILLNRFPTVLLKSFRKYEESLCLLIREKDRDLAFGHHAEGSVLRWNSRVRNVEEEEEGGGKVISYAHSKNPTKEVVKFKISDSAPWLGGKPPVPRWFLKLKRNLYVVENAVERLYPMGSKSSYASVTLCFRGDSSNGFGGKGRVLLSSWYNLNSNKEKEEMFYRELVLDNNSLVIRNIDGAESSPPVPGAAAAAAAGNKEEQELNSVKIAVDSVKKWYSINIEWLVLSVKKRVRGRWRILDEDGVFRNGVFDHDMTGKAKPGGTLKIDEKYAESNIPKVLTFGGRNTIVDDPDSRRYCATSFASLELIITKNEVNEGQEDNAFMSETMCKTILKETLAV